MKFDLRSWLTGYALGLAGKPLPFAVVEEREPVAYLYNGVRLPKLPNYDKTKYLHVVILYVVTGVLSTRKEQYEVWLSPLPLVSKILSYDGPGFRVPNDGVTYEYMYFKCDVGGTEWIEGAKYTVSYNESGYNGYPIRRNENKGTVWTDNDIFNEDDGTLYLAASEPVPVYE